MNELDNIIAKIKEKTAEKDIKIATCESCTAGWIAKVLTDQAGSSAWFEGGIVSYSNKAKQDLLGVDSTTLSREGAVSESTVKQMVSGVLNCFANATIGVAVTGVAGPSGGRAEKPVGTVWIGWQKRHQPAQAHCFHFSGDRDAVRWQTVVAALQGLVKQLA